MTLKLMMDVHIPRQVTSGLRTRDIDVLTAQEDGADEMLDPDLIDRATALERVLFSFDDDLLSEAARRQTQGIAFSGIVSTKPLRVSIGRMIDDLWLLCQVYDPIDMLNKVEYLPL